MIKDNDTARLRQGILLLVVVIMIGVTVAETQLNRLTHRQEFAQAFAVKRDSTGQYETYLFGGSVKARAVYPVARITNGHEVIVNIGGDQWIMPVRVHVDAQAIIAKLAIWYKLILNEAIEFKQSFQQYLPDFWQELLKAYSYFR